MSLPTRVPKILQQYYKWLLGKPIEFLKKNRIAVWDVIESCRRKGAADQKIRSERPNDIPRLSRKFPNIKKIFLNGRLAQKLYQKYFDGQLSLPVYYLPSTSPANAGLSFKEKAKKWRVIVNGS